MTDDVLSFRCLKLKEKGKKIRDGKDIARGYRWPSFNKLNDGQILSAKDIVFHYYYDVPYKEKDGYICNSYG